jgi:flagellar FliJ protein
MADLESLIRFRKHTVDEKQKILTALYRDAENLERQRQTLIDKMEEEKRLAAEMNMPDIQQSLMRYLDGSRIKIKAFDIALKRLESRIDFAREDIRLAFAEQKKIEITQEARQKAAKAALKKKEDQTMDDIALDSFNRKLRETDEKQDH